MATFMGSQYQMPSAAAVASGYAGPHLLHQQQDQLLSNVHKGVPASWDGISGTLGASAAGKRMHGFVPAIGAGTTVGVRGSSGSSSSVSSIQEEAPVPGIGIQAVHSQQQHPAHRSHRESRSARSCSSISEAVSQSAGQESKSASVVTGSAAYTEDFESEPPLTESPERRPPSSRLHPGGAPRWPGASSTAAAAASTDSAGARASGGSRRRSLAKQDSLEEQEQRVLQLQRLVDQHWKKQRMLELQRQEEQLKKQLEQLGAHSLDLEAVEESAQQNLREQQQVIRDMVRERSSSSTGGAAAVAAAAGASAAAGVEIRPAAFAGSVASSVVSEGSVEGRLSRPIKTRLSRAAGSESAEDSEVGDEQLQPHATVAGVNARVSGSRGRLSTSSLSGSVVHSSYRTSHRSSSSASSGVIDEVLDGEDIEVDFGNQLGVPEELIDAGLSRSSTSSGSSDRPELQDAAQLCSSSNRSIHELPEELSKCSEQVVEDYIAQVQLLSRAHTQEFQESRITSQTSSPGVAATVAAVRSMSVQYSEDFAVAEDSQQVEQYSSEAVLQQQQQQDSSLLAGVPAAAVASSASMQYSDGFAVAEEDQQQLSAQQEDAISMDGNRESTTEFPVGAFPVGAIQPPPAAGTEVHSSCTSSSSSSSASIVEDIEEEIEVQFSEDELCSSADNLRIDVEMQDTAAAPPPTSAAVSAPVPGYGGSMVTDADLVEAANGEYSDDFAASVSRQYSALSDVGASIQQPSVGGEGVCMAEEPQGRNRSSRSPFSSVSGSIVSEEDAAADVLLAESSQEWQKLLETRQQQQGQQHQQEEQGQAAAEGQEGQLEPVFPGATRELLSRGHSTSEHAALSAGSLQPFSSDTTATDTRMLDAIDAGIDALVAELAQSTSQDIADAPVDMSDEAATAVVANGVGAAGPPVQIEGVDKEEMQNSFTERLGEVDQAGAECKDVEEEQQQEAIVQEQRSRAWSWHLDAEESESASEASAGSSSRRESWVGEGVLGGEESSESLAVSLGQKNSSVSSSRASPTSRGSMESDSAAGGGAAAVARAIAGRVVEAAVAEALGEAGSSACSATAQAESHANSGSEFELEIQDGVVEEEDVLREQRLGVTGRWGEMVGPQQQEEAPGVNEEEGNTGGAPLQLQVHGQQEVVDEGRFTAAPSRYSAALLDQARQLLLTQDDEDVEEVGAAEGTAAMLDYTAGSEVEEEDEGNGLGGRSGSWEGREGAAGGAAAGRDVGFLPAVSKVDGDYVQKMPVQGSAGVADMGQLVSLEDLRERDVLAATIDEAFNALVADVIQEAVGICSSSSRRPTPAVANADGGKGQQRLESVTSTSHAAADDIAAAEEEGERAAVAKQREGERAVPVEDHSRTSSRSSSRSGSCQPDWLSSPEPTGSSPVPYQRSCHQEEQQQEEEEVLPAAVASSMEWPVSHVPDWQLTPLSDYETPRPRVPLRSEGGMQVEGEGVEVGQVDEVQRLLGFEESESPEPQQRQQQLRVEEDEEQRRRAAEAPFGVAAAAASEALSIETSLSISISQVGDLTEELVVGGTNSSSSGAAGAGVGSLEEAAGVGRPVAAAAGGIEEGDELVLSSGAVKAAEQGREAGAEGWFGSARTKGPDEEEFSWDEYEQSMLAVSSGLVALGGISAPICHFCTVLAHVGVYAS